MRLTATITVAATVSSAAAQFGNPDVETFFVPIPEIGTELFLGNGGIPNSNDFNGAIITDARLELVLDVFETGPGDERNSSAANFVSEIIVPVDLDPLTPGVQAALIVINGADEGWSGTGRFTISRTLDELIGSTWSSPLFYSASTYNGISQDDIVLGTINGFFTSFISVTADRTVPSPATLGLLAGAGMLARRRR